MSQWMFLLLAALGTTCAGSTRETIPIAVEVELPWSIQFTIPTSARFQPLSLTAAVHRDADRVISFEVEFTMQAEGSSERFRNSRPLRLQAQDVVEATLEYSSRKERVVRRVAFNYTIQRKQFDVLILNFDAELDSNFDPTKLKSTESVDESVPGTTTKLTRDSAQHSPSLKQRDVDCLPFESMNALAAENRYLEAQLQMALNVGHIGTQLALTGSLPPDPNAVDAVRALITDKLQLPHLSQSLLQARFVDQDLLFEMASPRHKLEVLTKARAMLERSPYKVASSDRGKAETAVKTRLNNLQ